MYLFSKNHIIKTTQIFNTLNNQPMKHIFPLFAFITFSSLYTLAQTQHNLVPNGSFETLHSDSLIHDFLDIHEFNTQMKDWITPQHGSTDILNPKFWYDEIPKSSNGNIAVGMKINTYYSKEKRELIL